MKQVVVSFSPVPCYLEGLKPGPLDLQELGFKWLDWTAEFSADCVKNYELVLLVRPQCELPDSINAWGKVTRFAENSFVAQYPLGANLVFRQVLWLQVHNKVQGPFLWCEPDCVPVQPDWLDLISEEYKRGAKPFMGNIVEPIYDKELGKRVPRHMTGNAVYPDKAHKEAPKLMEANYTPWDVLAAEQILSKCHRTDLIQHEFRCPQITNANQLAQILKRQTALFHADKFGSIMQLMGSGIDEVDEIWENGSPQPEPAAPRPARQAAAFAQRPEVVKAQEMDLDGLLGALLELCNDMSARKRAARFLVEHNIVNHGHLGYYKPKKVPRGKSSQQPLSDAEFKDRIDAGLAPTD